MPTNPSSTSAALLVVLLLAAAAVLLNTGGRWAAGAGRRRPGARAARSGSTLRRSRAPGSRDTDRIGLPAPVLLELCAAMLEAGASLEHALAVLSGVADGTTGRGLATVVSALRLGANWQQAWAAAAAEGRTTELVQLQEALLFAAATGAPSSSLLSAQAQQLRRRSYREAEKRAAALGVKLVLPMGLCALPAFVCLGVLPVLLALMPALD